MDEHVLRHTFGKFTTGITVVTGLDSGSMPIGVTINSFSSVSLVPPLVSFCLDRNNKHFQSFYDGDYFVVNILSKAQRHLSDMFAAPLPHDFSNVPYQLSSQGLPLFDEGLGNISCRIKERYDGGDHIIFVGEVIDCVSREGDPLLYFAGSYRTF